MSTHDQVDTILGAWFDEGPTDLPDVTRRAVLTAIPTTRQARRGPFAPGRFFPMPTPFRAVGVIAIAMVAIGGAVYLFGLGGSSGPGGLEPTPSVHLSPTLAPTPSTQASPDDRTPSPLEGRAGQFPVPYTYRLPAGQDLVASLEDPLWQEFRHPKPNGQVGWDRGVVIRAISGGRVDPCQERSATRPMADPQAFLDYFRTVPTMELTSEETIVIDGFPGIEVTAGWADPTEACPNVWLWPEEGSITDLGGRQPSRLSIIDVAGTFVFLNTFGPDEWTPYADEFIASIDFDQVPPASQTP